ncbi:MAG: amidohydrolase family protein [Hyphomonadaceae bacterium]
MADGFVLEIPEMAGIAPPPLRKPQIAKTPWPKGTVIVSADSHFMEGDFWVDHYPPELKAYAPRMRFEDGGWRLTINGKDMYPDDKSVALCDQFECAAGFQDIAARLADLDAEGVEKELLFPQRVMGLYRGGDIDFREHLFSGYNRGMARVCAQAPSRLYFVAIPNYWDSSAAQASVAEAKALGPSALMVPIDGRKDINGDQIFWNSPKMDPFWEAVSESGLPLCFHIGENLVGSNLPGGICLSSLVSMQGFRNVWGALTFGGVFDRFPKLRVVFVEGGISWVASMIHDADMLYNAFDMLASPRLKHAPSWYWFNHCYATFMTDPAGLEVLHRIGADRVMWSSDYPHAEGTLGYTSSTIQAVFDAAPDVESAQKMLGLTALDVFAMR